MHGPPGMCIRRVGSSQMCVVPAGVHCPVLWQPWRVWWPRPADGCRDGSVGPDSLAAVISKSPGHCPPDTVLRSHSRDVGAMGLPASFVHFRSGLRRGWLGRMRFLLSQQPQQEGTATPMHSQGPAPHLPRQQRLSSPCLGFLICEQPANSACLLRGWED